ncbi:glycosyltransferase [Nonlabens ponticola]|uniref:Glycosyltransferase n=1 Tax=Nonlabens ponticola TaxID=2496866 RepID=A0A3S9MVH7_9FLAO|nr:glycosyltransferase [Nonlabens ponticola]AZQ43123.1 glycosyltransferase [Nonlabens ponticola]
MSERAKKLIIVQNIIPGYRVPFFEYLKEHLGDRFELVAGDSTFERSIKSDDSIEIDKRIINRYLLRRKFIYNKGISNLKNTHDSLVLELNPRNVTVWSILIYRKLRGLKTTLWGHAWPRSGSDSASDKLRNAMRSLATHIITYTTSQKKELQERMPQASISASSNALMRQEEMTTSTDPAGINNVIYVGRLVPEKKPMLLVKGFHQAIKNLPTIAKLIVIGSGPEKELINAYIKAHELDKCILVKDPIFDNSVLKEYYLESLVSVSPGYVGLNLIQSLSFGVPMIISKDEIHSPEIEAANSNNSIFIKTDDVDGLAKSLIDIYHSKQYWVEQRENIMQSCKEKYSIERMAQPFLNLVDV